MHWQDFQIKSNSNIKQQIVQSPIYTRHNHFVNQKNLNLNTPDRSRNFSSQMIIQSAVSRVKDQREQSNRKQKEFLKTRVKQIVMGQASLIDKNKHFEGLHNRNKRATPDSIYKIVRDLRNFLYDIKVLFYRISQQLKNSLVEWKKSMDQMGRKSASLIIKNLQKMSSAVNSMKFQNDNILAESTPQKQIMKQKRFVKKYTLPSIPDDHEDDKQDIFNFQLKEKSVINMRFPDLSGRDKKEKKQQIISQDLESNSKSYVPIQRSSNLDNYNIEKSIKKKNTLSDEIPNFQADSPQQNKDIKENQLFQQKVDNSKRVYEQEKVGTAKFIEKGLRKKNSDEKSIRRSQSRKKQIAGDFDDINNYLLKLKLMVQ